MGTFAALALFVSQRYEVVVTEEKLRRGVSFFFFLNAAIMLLLLPEAFPKWIRSSNSFGHAGSSWQDTYIRVTYGDGFSEGKGGGFTFRLTICPEGITHLPKLWLTDETTLNFTLPILERKLPLKSTKGIIGLCM